MTRPTPTDNVVSIAAALENPADAPTMAQPGDQAPFGGRDDDDAIDRPHLPRDCPVRPLGVGTDGRTCWYLNVLGQIVTLTPREHGKNDINLLFAPKTHLATGYWPQWSKPITEGRGANKVIIKESEIIGFAQNDASEALIAACGEVGIFDAQGRVRGRGAHLGKGGALILHCGDKVMMAARRIDGKPKASSWHDPGVIDGYVYPASAPVPRPHHEPVDDEAGMKLLALLSTWRWARPGIDPMLLLGWIAQCFVAGAQDWRSHVFLTGGAGTGKSHINGKGYVLDRLFGGGMMRSSDTTAAAVRQKLQGQTVPVALDEFEADEMNAAKVKAVLELARVASSGDEAQRGGQDHKAHDFTLQSCFLFSAIIPPPFKPADRSRFAMLELQPFDGSEPALDLDAAKLPELGRALARRMVDGWHRLPETLRLYRKALSDVGHSARACDQFGTLLACADVLLYDHIPDAELLDVWARRITPDGMSEIADAQSEHDACLNHIRTTTVQARGGEDRTTLSSWLGDAVSIDLAGSGSETARRRLHELGLAVVNRRWIEPKDKTQGHWGAMTHMPGQPAYLAIAASHRAVRDMFAAERWADGGWVTVLGRAPGATRGVKVKFGKLSLTSTLVPLELVIDADGIPGFVTALPGPDGDSEGAT